MTSARTVNLSHLAGVFCGPAKLASNDRRLQRFFRHVRLDGAWLARALVKLLDLAPPFRLCLDRTNWKVGAKDINLLVLCIATRRVRIPVLWDILDHRGCSTMAQRQALLTRFMALFGKRSIGLLLADGEFVGDQWFEFLADNNIPFAIRVSGRFHVRLSDGYQGPLERLAATKPSRTRLMKAKGCFAGMAERFAHTLRFGAIQLDDGALLIVASTLAPRKAMHLYKSRWQIECLFADTKTRGFNMEDTRLTKPEKLGLLLAIPALAIAWTNACATALKPTGDIARATHGHRRKSWFRTGFDILSHWLFTKPHLAQQRWNTIWRRVPARFYKPRVV